MGKRTAGVEAAALFDNARLSIGLGTAVGEDQDSLIRDALSKAIRPRFLIGTLDTSQGSPVQDAITDANEDLGIDPEVDSRIARDLIALVKESMAMRNPEAASIERAKRLILDRSVAINGFATNIRDIPLEKPEFIQISGHLIDFAKKTDPEEVEAAGGVEGLRVDYDPRTETLEITSADLFSQPLVSITKKQLMLISQQFDDLVNTTRISDRGIEESTERDRLESGDLTLSDIFSLPGILDPASQTNSRSG